MCCQMLKLFLSIYVHDNIMARSCLEMFRLLVCILRVPVCVVTVVGRHQYSRQSTLET